MTAPKLSELVIANIAESVLVGLPASTCGALCDPPISARAIQKWLKAGREAIAAMEAESGASVRRHSPSTKREKKKLEHERLCVKLVIETERAKAMLIRRNAAVVQKAASEGEWRAATWCLSKADPKNFGTAAHVEVSAGDDMKPATTSLAAELQAAYEAEQKQNKVDNLTETGLVLEGSGNGAGDHN